MARQLFVMGAIFIGVCMVVAASAAEWKASRKMLQWGQWATSDAIGRAVDSGADMWSTRNAAAVGTWGGWGAGRNWVGKH